MTALRELFASFAFEFEDAKLKAADAGVNKLAQDLGGVDKAVRQSETGLRSWFDSARTGVEALGAVVAGGLFAREIGQFADQLDTLDDLSAQTGILTDQLQLLGYAAKVNGSSQEEMFASLTRLQMAMGRTADAGGPVAQVLKKMGVDIGNATTGPRRLSEALPEILSGFGNLESEAEQAQAAMTLFGRTGVRLLPILRQGEEGMAALNEEFENFGGPVAAETIALAGEYKDMVTRLDTALFKLKGNLAGAVFPQMSKIVETTAHAAAAIGEWAKGTTLAETAAVGLSATLLHGLWPALAPFLKGGLKFGAIFLAVDEVVAFLKGHDSLIGRLLNRAFGDGTADKVRDWVNDAIGALGQFQASATSTFEAVESASLLSMRGMTAAVVGFVRDAVDGFPVFIAGAQRTFQRIELELNRAVLSMQNTWNAFVSGLALPDTIKAALTIDTSGTLNAVAAAENNLIAATERQTAAELGQVDPVVSRPGQGLITGRERTGRTAQFDDSITLPEQAGGVPAVALIPGPVRPDVAPSFSMVQTAPINIYLPAGTPAAQAEAVGRAAQQGIREANRSARQALVPRK